MGSPCHNGTCGTEEGNKYSGFCEEKIHLIMPGVLRSHPQCGQAADTTPGRRRAGAQAHCFVFPSIHDLNPLKFQITFL